jgi:hypothetical protein
VIFRLERFVWGAPDRLELSGKFVGWSGVVAEAAELVLRDAESIYRLPAVAEASSGVPEDGQRWHAVFAWPHAPAPFAEAWLMLGPEVVVELPEPGARRRPFGGQVLTVRRAPREQGASEAADGAWAQVRSEAERVAAQGELEEVTAARRQTDELVAGIRETVAAERDVRVAQAERYREGILAVRASTEEALLAERGTIDLLTSDLRDAQDAIEAKDAQLEMSREALEQAATEREQAGAAARAEIDALRARLAELERDDQEVQALRLELARLGADADTLRSELDRAQTEFEHTRAAADTARHETEAARADNERLHSQITIIREALNAPG